MEAYNVRKSTPFEEKCKTPCGGLILAKGQKPTQLLSHPLLLNRTGGESSMRKLMGGGEDREITYQLPSQAK